MRQIIFFAATVFFLFGCAKDKAIDPLQKLTEKNIATIKNTEWYGLYRNKGEETYGNNSGFRGYAIAFGADSAFTFYGAGLAIKGVWLVNGDTVRLRFASGAENRWVSILNSDSVLNIITSPVPDNFMLDRNLKKIPDPPLDVIGHKWKENSTSTSAFTLEFRDKSAGMGFPTTYQMGYTNPPIKNKIFNVANAGIGLYFLLIVDGKTAWTFDNTAYNFQYNY